MLKRIFVSLLICGAVAALAPATASATPIACNTISYGGSTATDDSLHAGLCEIVFTGSVNFNSTPFSGYVSVAKWNSAFGTLQYVQGSLAVNGSVDMSLVAGPDGSLIYSDSKTKETVRLTRPDSLVTTAIPAYQFVADVSLSAFQPYDTGWKAVSASADFNPTDLALYTGSGSFSLPVTASAQSVLDVEGDYTDAASRGKGSVTVTLKYDFLAPEVPEPFTLSMLGSGLVLMGWMGRSRIKGRK